jgi:hypothetical protein
MLYEGFLPTFPPVAGTLDFKGENHYIKVWIDMTFMRRDHAAFQSRE